MKFKLLFIFGLAFFLRIIFINQLPLGFTPDEASFGYDAFSILKTGRDQWGNFMPLSLKSFGDDKLPVYTYLTIPFIYIFGLKEFAVRLPNIILSSLAVFSIYFLGKELFNKKIGIWSAFLLAVSPWHIQLSRGAFEANLTVFFLPLAIYLFLKSLRLQSFEFLILSFFLFFVNTFTYHSARVVSLALLAVLIVISFKQLLKFSLNKKIILFIVIFLIFLLNIYYLFIAGSGRLGTSTIFSSTYYDWIFQKRFDIQKTGVKELVLKIFFNKFTAIFSIFIENYLSYFSFVFLFAQGAREGTYGMITELGVLYLFEIFFLMYFLISIEKMKNKKSLFLIIFALFFSPIPAAISIGPGHAANRAVVMLPFLIIVLSIGLTNLMNTLKIRNLNYFVVFIYLFFLVLFFQKYYFLQRTFYARNMIYGTSELFGLLKDVKAENIYVSKSISEAHIYFAFYNQYNPKLFQQEASRWNFDIEKYKWVDQMPEYKLSNYIFTSTPFSDLEIDNNFFVGKPEDFQNVNFQENSILKIKDLRSEDIYWIAKLSNE